jgi:hypothetical protein
MRPNTAPWARLVANESLDDVRAARERRRVVEDESGRY